MFGAAGRIFVMPALDGNLVCLEQLGEQRVGMPRQLLIRPVVEFEPFLGRQRPDRLLVVVCLYHTPIPSDRRANNGPAHVSPNARAIPYRPCLRWRSTGKMGRHQNPSPPARFQGGRLRSRHACSPSGRTSRIRQSSHRRRRTLANRPTGGDPQMRVIGRQTSPIADNAARRADTPVGRYAARWQKKAAATPFG